MPKVKRVEKFEFYENARGDFAWHKVATNGKIIAQGEGYSSESNVLRFLRRENKKLINPIPIIKRENK